MRHKLEAGISLNITQQQMH